MGKIPPGMASGYSAESFLLRFVRLADLLALDLNPFGNSAGFSEILLGESVLQSTFASAQASQDAAGPAGF
jgi:hypothetical protein